MDETIMVTVEEKRSGWGLVVHELFFKMRLVHFVAVLNCLLITVCNKAGLAFGSPSPSTMSFLEFFAAVFAFAAGFLAVYLLGQTIIAACLLLGGFIKKENSLLVKKKFYELWYDCLFPPVLNRVPKNICQGYWGIFRTSAISPFISFFVAVLTIFISIGNVLWFLIYLAKGKIIDPLDFDRGGALFTQPTVYFSFRPGIIYMLSALFFLSQWFNGRFAELDPEKSVSLVQYSFIGIAGVIVGLSLGVIGIPAACNLGAKWIAKRRFKKPVKWKNFTLVLKEVYKAIKEKYCPIVTGVEE